MSTTVDQTSAALGGPAPRARGLRRARRGSSRAVVWLSLPLAAIALLCLLGPLVLPLPPADEQDLAAALRPPVFDGGSWSHPLGTDKLGRDMLARVLEGGRLTIFIGLAGMVLAIVPGTIMGLIAGYAGGKVDAVISRLIDAQLALPFVLVALAIISNRGPSVGVLLLVLALTGWAVCARVTRAAAMSLRERPFILGLRAAGASPARIVARHVLPNLGGILVVLATLQIGTAILVESALSFLGMGVVAPSISWGAILASGKDILAQAWWVTAIPGIAITVTVVLVNLLGDALLSHHDPTKRRY